MPWFKVDDTFAFHHKVVAAGNSAIGLWCRAGSLCAQQLTDGFVPAHMVTALGGKSRDAAELVRAGLWDEVPGGWRFHGWDEFQPTRESVTEERRAARARKDRWKEKRNDDGTRSEQDAERVPNARRTMPRPDPTRPVVKDYGEVDHHPTVRTARDPRDNDENLNQKPPMARLR